MRRHPAFCDERLIDEGEVAWSPPGEQAQVDWGHFGHLQIGCARRPLMAFVMVLSYSRRICLRFFRFNPVLLKFASHYCYEPRPVAVARGNEKGRVERAIRYARDNSFAARKYTDLDDLNARACLWCEGPASDRCWPQDPAVSVREAFHAEQANLLALPEREYALAERLAVTAGKTPYIRFDLNDYSFPTPTSAEPCPYWPTNTGFASATARRSW